MPLFVLLFFSFALAKNDREPQVVAGTTTQSEAGKYDLQTSRLRTELKHRYLCRNSTGRKLFKMSNVGLPVGLLVTAGSGLYSIANIVDGNPNVVNSAVTAIGAGILIFSIFALPTSTKYFYEESKKVGLTTSLTRGKIILANTAIISGFVLIITPLSPFLLLAGYGFHEIQGLKMLSTWNCTKYGL